MTTDRNQPSSRWLPPEARQGCVVVCERSGRWSAALRRYWSGLPPATEAHKPDIIQVPGWPACERVLCWRPASVAVLECDHPPTIELLDWLAVGSRRFPAALFILVGDRLSDEAELLLREAGASAVARSVRCVASSARLAMRHLAQAPPVKIDLREAIWERLPWREFAVHTQPPDAPPAGESRER